MRKELARYLAEVGCKKIDTFDYYEIWRVGNPGMDIVVPLDPNLNQFFPMLAEALSMTILPDPEINIRRLPKDFADSLRAYLKAYWWQKHANTSRYEVWGCGNLEVVVPLWRSPGYNELMLATLETLADFAKLSRLDVIEKIKAAGRGNAKFTEISKPVPPPALPLPAKKGHTYACRDCDWYAGERCGAPASKGIVEHSRPRIKPTTTGCQAFLKREFLRTEYIAVDGAAKFTGKNKEGRDNFLKESPGWRTINVLHWKVRRGSVPKRIDLPAETKDFIGLTVANAANLAESRGLRVRIVREDDIPRVVTRDYCPDRVNFTVRSSVVVGATLG